MNQSAFVALRDFMAVIWQLFTGWHLPFTNVTPAMLIFFTLSINLIIKFVNSLLTVNAISLGYGATDELKRVQRASRRQ